MDWVWLNGGFVVKSEAKISVFDRGFLFADAVYEVTAVLDGKLVDFDAHYERLKRSCRELDLALPYSHDEMRAVHLQLMAKNNLAEGGIYLQLTGGVTDRDFTIDRTIPVTVLLFTQAKNLRDMPDVKTGQRVMTIEDERWARRDIKTTQLLSQSLARSKAVKAGLDDAWLVTDGMVNEGCSNNAFIVTTDDKIVTRPRSNKILSGITRKAVLDCAAEFNLEIEDRPFSIAEAKASKEAFSTSASTFVMPVVEIDGAQIGGGKPGPVTLRLRELYIKRALSN